MSAKMFGVLANIELECQSWTSGSSLSRRFSVVSLIYLWISCKQLVDISNLCIMLEHLKITKVIKPDLWKKALGKYPFGGVLMVFVFLSWTGYYDYSSVCI